MFDGMSWVYGRSTPCLVFDGGLSTLDYVEWSLMGAFLIEDYPMLLK